MLLVLLLLVVVLRLLLLHDRGRCGGRRRRVLLGAVGDEVLGALALMTPLGQGAVRTLGGDVVGKLSTVVAPADLAWLLPAHGSPVAPPTLVAARAAHEGGLYPLVARLGLELHTLTLAQ